ncbi:DUF1697 domain-containing protein [Actinoplanes sp. NPDC051859]|uniref:DUF1697 domain-containing protein n=1 Tax=Actinoplanes sp. NPDC051859 TaxID=3363909 RepID=UPI0037BE093E
MTRYAVLLRGINLGKARRVGMADLRAVLTESGYGDVRTLLQSGNVVLDADEDAGTLRQSVERVLADRFGFGVDALVRSRDDLATVVARNPFATVATDGSKYVVAFLAEPPSRPLAQLLGDVDLGADRYEMVGTELYAWCPDGLQKSPLMGALGKLKGGPSATVRNWNTVEKLVALLA